jgi:ribose transport system substrate-binding protein
MAAICTAGLAVSVALSGCGNDEGGGGTKAETGSDMPADTSGPARESVKAGTGCGENKDQHCPIELMPGDHNREEIAQALMDTPAREGSIDDLINEDRANPTEWAGPTEPVSLPGEALSIVGISCNSALSGCVAPLEAIGELSDELGYDFTLYDGQGNGETISKYMLSSITSGVDAIFVAGVDPLTIQQGLEEADKASIPVISITSALSTPNPVVEAPPDAFWPLFDLSSNFVMAGRAMADWAIWDSKGEGTIIVLDGKEGTSQVSSAAVVDEINKQCPKCKTLSYTVLGAEVGTTFPQKTLAFLRNHPDAKYIILPYDPAAAALVPVLQQAGQTDVRLISVIGMAENLQFIRDGQSQTADVAWDCGYEGWAAMDQLFRYLAGQEFSEPIGENTPQILLDSTNVGTGSGNWTSDIDYRAEYRQLWGLA